MPDKGGRGGGIPLVNAKAPDFVLAILNQGRNKMSALAASLTPKQLRDIHRLRHPHLGKINEVRPQF